MRAPVAYGFRAGVAQRHVAGRHRMDLRTEHPHTFHIRMLTLHICLAHENLASHAHERAHGCRSHSVLSGTCLRYDACLSHPACHQYLPHRVVYLMRSGMVQILSFKIKPASVFCAHASCMIQRRRSAHIVSEQLMIFLPELLTVYYAAV